MTQHYEQERTLHGRIEGALVAAMPQVAVLDVELDAPRQRVRLYVDHPDGVDHQLCARVTSVLRDTCPQYTLEVSSPGTERPLRSGAHFQAAVGGRVRLRLRGGGQRAYVATVLDAGDDWALVQRDSGDSQRIELSHLARTHLVEPPRAAGDAAASVPTQATSTGGPS